MPMLNMRLLSPTCLIDLNNVAGLDRVDIEGDEITIGSMVRQRELQRSSIISRELPVFAKALRHVGHVQTRNRGTIGGSLCHLDPSAEVPAIALAYDAVIEVVGPERTRQLTFVDFPISYLTSALRPDEILSSIRLKPWKGLVGCGFQEFSRRHGDFAIAGAVVLVSLADDLTVCRIAVTLFGVTELPIRLTAVEHMLVGRTLNAATIIEAANSCIGLATMDDAFGSAAYRGHVACAMVERALSEAASEAMT